MTLPQSAEQVWPWLVHFLPEFWRPYALFFVAIGTVTGPALFLLVAWVVRRIGQRPLDPTVDTLTTALRDRGLSTEQQAELAEALFMVTQNRAKAKGVRAHPLNAQSMQAAITSIERIVSEIVGRNAPDRAAKILRHLATHPAILANLARARNLVTVPRLFARKKSAASGPVPHI